MLYKINNKYYIKVQGYYKEVDVSIKGDNLEIKPNNGLSIEITKVKNVKVVDMKTENFNRPKEVEKESKFEKPRKLNKEIINKDWR